MSYIGIINVVSVIGDFHSVGFPALFVLLLQVVQDILEHEREFVKELQTVLSCYLRPLQASDK